MKFLKLIIFSLLIMNCKTEKKSSTVEINKGDEIVNEALKIIEERQESIQNENRLINNLDFDLKEILNQEMVGVSMNDDEKEPTKKFTYDVSGACYSCDLANIKINKSDIILTNICETSEKNSFKITKIEKVNKQYQIYFNQNKKEVVLLLTKIEELPIYNITINNNFEKIENFKINNFYIDSKDLIKLEIHDCGDFDG